MGLGFLELGSMGYAWVAHGFSVLELSYRGLLSLLAMLVSAWLNFPYSESQKVGTWV